MKIVKFRDGTYAVRRGLFEFEYLDIKCADYWWSFGYPHRYKGTIE